MHIPLIGIASWNRVEHKEELAVEEGQPNLGYDTKLPVKYVMNSHAEGKSHHAKDTHEAKGEFLDPNHSHFILLVQNAAQPPFAPTPGDADLATAAAGPWRKFRFRALRCLRGARPARAL